jgi:outer membrane protein TolC
MVTKRIVAAGFVALLLPITAACSGGSSKGAAPAAKVSASATAPADPAAAEAQIRTNWAAFFDYNTPAAKSAALLENGDSLAGAIAFAKREQAQTHIKQGAKVVSVSFTGAVTATVTYQLLNGTQVLLPSASGVAVFSGGAWKVSKASFCTLVQLGANGGTVPGC